MCGPVRNRAGPIFVKTKRSEKMLYHERRRQWRRRQ
ncbi:MAG: hypothetical protein JW912_07175 [Sedimentisphaerales bacterium]|nr:hypothetical protein [Sedimentisphaerales bacterium]